MHTVAPYTFTHPHSHDTHISVLCSLTAATGVTNLFAIALTIIQGPVRRRHSFLHTKSDPAEREPLRPRDVPPYLRRHRRDVTTMCASFSSLFTFRMCIMSLNNSSLIDCM